MKPFILGALLLCAANASASKLSYEGQIKGGKLDFKDPDGSTESPIFFVPYFGVGWSLGRDSRLFTGVEYLRGSFEGGEANIKQDTEGYGLNFGYERELTVSFTTKIWLGGSVGYKDLAFKDRRTEDRDGFTGERFNDRDSSFGTVEMHAKSFIGAVGFGVFSEFSEYGSFLGLSISVKH